MARYPLLKKAQNAINKRRAPNRPVTPPPSASAYKAAGHKAAGANAFGATSARAKGNVQPKRAPTRTPYGFSGHPTPHPRPTAKAHRYGGQGAGSRATGHTNSAAGRRTALRAGGNARLPSQASSRAQRAVGGRYGR